MPALFTRHDFHKPKKKRERGVLASPHHNDGTFTVGQPSLNSTLSPKLRGDELPQLYRTKLGGIWRISERHTITDIRCLVAGYSGPFEWAASPSLLPLDQNYNSQGAPYVTLRAIAFNSHRENLLTIYLTFTLLTHSSISPLWWRD